MLRVKSSVSWHNWVGVRLFKPHSRVHKAPRQRFYPKNRPTTSPAAAELPQGHNWPAKAAGPIQPSWGRQGGGGLIHGVVAEQEPRLVLGAEFAVVGPASVLNEKAFPFELLLQVNFISA